jgi:hypothetical protein
MGTFFQHERDAPSMANDTIVFLANPAFHDELSELVRKKTVLKLGRTNFELSLGHARRLACLSEQDTRTYRQLSAINASRGPSGHKAHG